MWEAKEEMSLSIYMYICNGTLSKLVRNPKLNECKSLNTLKLCESVYPKQIRNLGVTVKSGSSQGKHMKLASTGTASLGNCDVGCLICLYLISLSHVVIGKILWDLFERGPLQSDWCNRNGPAFISGNELLTQKNYTYTKVGFAYHDSIHWNHLWSVLCNNNNFSC